MKLRERGPMASCPEHTLPSSTWGHAGSGDLRAQQGSGVRDCAGPEEELNPPPRKGHPEKVVML